MEHNKYLLNLIYQIKCAYLSKIIDVVMYNMETALSYAIEKLDDFKIKTCARCSMPFARYYPSDASHYSEYIKSENGEITIMEGVITFCANLHEAKNGHYVKWNKT